MWRQDAGSSNGGGRTPAYNAGGDGSRTVNPYADGSRTVNPYGGSTSYGGASGGGGAGAGGAGGGGGGGREEEETRGETEGEGIIRYNEYGVETVLRVSGFRF